MLFTLVAPLLALAANCVTAQSDPFIPSLASRQAGPSTTDCNATCTNFEALQASCTAPHCACTLPFVQAQGNCLLCRSTTPQDAASVQFLLDTETNQCQTEGIKVEFQLDLPPAAVEIVQQFNRDSASLRTNQTIFLALQIAGGHIGLVIVLAFAVFSRKVRRDPTFLNFCITWIFSSVVFSILLYRGTQGNTIANSLGEALPNHCLAQAALTEGAQVMTACSTLALVIQLWIGLRSAIHGAPTNGIAQSRWTKWGLLATPYIFFLAFALPSIFVGLQRVDVMGTILERTIPTNFYCTVIELNSFLRAVDGVTFALLLITVIFDVLIIRVLYKHWRAFRYVHAKSAVSLSILLRVIAFSIYRVAVAIAYGTVINKPPVLDSAGSGDSLALLYSIPVWVDMLQAAIPLIGFLVLGVNSHMINSFVFWRSVRSSNTSTGQSAVTTGASTVTRTWDEKAILEADNKFVPA